MRKPFVLRVQNDDPTVARAIARALVGPLTERGARTRLDGALVSTGGQTVVHVITAPRGVPGTSVVLGLFDEENGARWLAPLEVPDAPDAAAERILAFLSEWGFIGAPSSRVRATRPASAS